MCVCVCVCVCAFVCVCVLARSCVYMYGKREKWGGDFGIFGVFSTLLSTTSVSGLLDFVSLVPHELTPHSFCISQGKAIMLWSRSTLTVFSFGVQF